MDAVKFVSEDIAGEEVTEINFQPGDTISVHYKIKEGNKERIQIFKGVIIQIKGHGVNKTFTVRKISEGVGVERIFSVNSPFIDKIEVNRLGKVRRAKLYYLRDAIGKKARVKERRVAKKA